MHAYYEIGKIGYPPLAQETIGLQPIYRIEDTRLEVLVIEYCVYIPSIKCQALMT